MTQDLQILLISLTLVSGLFLMSLFRIFYLSRSNRRMRTDSVKLEKQAMLKELEVTAMHHDAMSWRAKTQRQFDALRSELSHRLQQSDQGGQHVLKEWAEAQKKALAAAQAHISELEAELAAEPPAVIRAGAAAAPPAFQPPSSMAGTPGKEALRIQSLESELAAARAEAANGRQQNAVLQRALLIARRRVPMPALRKSPPRNAARSN